MQNLTVTLTDNEQSMIASELEKLYSFQDRPLSKEKRVLIVQEIVSHGYPFKAIIQGIRDMFSDDLKTIKLASILQSIQEKIVVEEIQISDCDDCDGRGLVILLSDTRYEKVFACLCKNGFRWIERGLAQWSGEQAQFHRGVAYRIPERFMKVR